MTTWQALIDPQRDALCGDMAMPGPGRPVEEHSNMRSYLGVHRARWRG